MGRHRTEVEGRRRWLCGSLAALAAGLVPRSGLAWWGAPARPAGPGARRETRPTLEPARFVGKARAAHQVARDVPDVLDQLYCYCECDRTIGHKSLLSCYTDGHAAT